MASRPKLLSLELTETAVMTDRGLALTVLQALDSMGVSLSIDDFGTGYSSMSYLKTLPVKELKIDRSFVMGMANDPDSAVIVRSAVDLGHNLGMTVVAEGVQDSTTRSDLADMGCDLVQGYEICKPVPARELERWIETNLVAAFPPPAGSHEKVRNHGQAAEGEVGGNGQLTLLAGVIRASRRRARGRKELPELIRTPSATLPGCQCTSSGAATTPIPPPTPPSPWPWTCTRDQQDRGPADLSARPGVKRARWRTAEPARTWPGPRCRAG